MRKDREYWLCDDCLLIAVNDDDSGIDYSYQGIEAEARKWQCRSGVAALGPHLVPDFDSESGDGVNEFSKQQCHACRTWLRGQRHRFATLIEDDDA